MKILGISSFYHDSAAALLIDGQIVSAVQEERLNRIKNTSVFPIESIRYCLEENGLSIDDLDCIAYFEKPLLKFERVLETYYQYIPFGFKSFIKDIPNSVSQGLMIRKTISNKLKEAFDFNSKKLNLLFSDHHLSHASSTYYPSGFSDSAIITMDGVGEWSSTTICHGTGSKIKILKRQSYPNSLGLLYSSFTYFLGFKVNFGEYKLMGLSPYGNDQGEDFSRFKEIILTKLISLKDDGSIWLNQKYFSYSLGQKMIQQKKWEELFELSCRTAEDEITQLHCDLALAIQRVTELSFIRLARYAKEITNSSNLCLAGGVALNCVANGVLKREAIFKNIFVQPAAGDSGCALGSCYSVYYMYYKHSTELGIESMSKVYLGPKYTNKYMGNLIRKYSESSEYFSDFEKLCKVVASYIFQGKIVGWFQDRMEFGPRALGNRSILGNALDQNMQSKINRSIKYREDFRPFAPAVLSEDAGLYFEDGSRSDHMLFVTHIKEDLRQNPLESKFEKESLEMRLRKKRSEIPAITHVDYSARVQTVSKESNYKFWQLIDSFKKLSGYGVVINTSFNVRGEPIVCSPEDAYQCFQKTEMDVLVLNNFILLK